MSDVTLLLTLLVALYALRALSQLTGAVEKAWRSDEPVDLFSIVAAALIWPLSTIIYVTTFWGGYAAGYISARRGGR